MHIFGKHSSSCWQAVQSTCSCLLSPAHLGHGRSWLVSGGFCKHSHAGGSHKSPQDALLSSISDSNLCEFTWTILYHPPAQFDSFLLLVPLLKMSVRILGLWSLVWYSSLKHSRLVKCPRLKVQAGDLKTTGQMVPFQRRMFNVKQSESGNDWFHRDVPKALISDVHAKTCYAIFYWKLSTN